MTKDEIIHCESYYVLCDYHYNEHTKDNLQSGIVHVDTQSIADFFREISKRKYRHHRYIVISSRSDYGIVYQDESAPWKDIIKVGTYYIEPLHGYKGLVVNPTASEKCKVSHKYSIKIDRWTDDTFDEIPQNIVHWFSTNCAIQEERVTSIPFGINGTNGNQEAVNTLWDVMQMEFPLKYGMYVNFTPNTIYRALLKSFFTSQEPNVYINYKEKLSYNDYLIDIKKSSFNLCPLGNGIDSYRIYESLYLQTLPIIQDCFEAQALKNINIPAIYHPTLEVLPEEVLKLKWRTQYYEIKFDKLKFSYWKDLILGKLWT